MAIWPGITPSRAKLKTPMLSGGEAIAKHLEFVKQASQASTNWPKPEVVFKCPDNIFCHVRKLPSKKYKWDCLVKEIVTHKHEKIIQDGNAFNESLAENFCKIYNIKISFSKN